MASEQRVGARGRERERFLVSYFLSIFPSLFMGCFDKEITKADYGTDSLENSLIKTSDYSSL